MKIGIKYMKKQAISCHKIIEHQFPLFINEDSKILILGSFPSVKSRENNFYYMHPQNRFYKVLGLLTKENVASKSVEEKKDFLKRYKIALYDVIFSCSINNSSDSSIKDVTCINLKEIMDNYSIEKIFLNGQKAYSLFKRHFPEYLSLAYALPSTSPANAKMSLETLCQAYSTIFK